MLRILAWALALVLVALPVVAVVNGWVGSEHWPLRTLRVQGEFEHVDAGRVREIVLPHARKGFFAVELDATQAALADLPWVERAEVRKRWPDTLEVRIVEHQPFAHWGEDQLLSAQGRLFPAEGMPALDNLPHLSGPASRVDDVVAFYNEARVLFAGSGDAVLGVTLDRRGSWSLHLSSGMHVLVGRQDARPRLARFVRVLPKLRTRHEQPLARADLRYTNGFALRWQAGPNAQSPISNHGSNT